MTQLNQRRVFSAAVLSSCLLPALAGAQAGLPLELWLVPNISARILLNQYQPMREHLARVLQRPVHLSTAFDWAVFHGRVAANEYDLVVTAPHMARLAQLDHGWMPLLQLLPDIKAMLVFASARPMAAIADLRGKTLVLSNPVSLVALRGLRWLAENGLQRDKDFTTMTIPTDDSVGNVLGRGDALAALVSAGEFRAIAEGLRNQLQVFTVFAEVPGFVIAAGRRLGADQAQLIKSRLLEFVSPGSGEGAAFLAATGSSGLREISPDVMASMDVYVNFTRDTLARPL